MATRPSLVAAGAVATGTTSVAPTFGQATTAGNLLVAWVSSNPSGTLTVSDPSWTVLVVGGITAVAYKANCGANETAPSFTNVSSTEMFALLAEFTGVAATGILEDHHSLAGGGNSPGTNSIGVREMAPGSLALFVGQVVLNAAGTSTTTSAFRTSTPVDLANNDSSSDALHYRFSYAITDDNGATDQQTFTFTGTPSATGWDMSYIVMRPPGSRSRISRGRGSPSVATGTTSVAPTFGQATTAGNLLVAYVISDGAAGPATPAGWSRAVGLANGPCIFYKPNCAASETAPTFSDAGATFMAGFLMEYDGADTVDPLDKVATASGAASPITATMGGRSPFAGELVGGVGFDVLSKAGTVGTTDIFTPTPVGSVSGSWSNDSTSTVDHYHIEDDCAEVPNVAASVQMSDNSMNLTSMKLVAATFRGLLDGGSIEAPKLTARPRGRQFARRFLWWPPKKTDVPFVPPPPPGPRPVQARLRAGLSQGRRRTRRSVLPRPVGRALALTFVWPIRVLRPQAGRSQHRRRQWTTILIATRPALAIAAVQIRRYLQSQVRNLYRLRRASSRLRTPLRQAAQVIVYPLAIRVRLFAGRSQARRRIVRSRLQVPIGRAVARLNAYRVRILLAGRAVRDRRRAVRTKLRLPLGRALARAVPYRVRVFLQAGPTQRRLRKFRSLLRRPVRAVVQVIYPLRVRVSLAGRAVRDRRRVIRSRLRLPVGRAVARGYAYAVRVVTTQATRSQARRRAIRSRLRRPILVLTVIGKAIKVRVALAGRAVRDRRRALRSRLRAPVGRALARINAYRVRAAFAGRSVRDRRRIILSRLRRPVGRATALLRPYRVKVALAGRAVRDRRRIVRALRLRVFGFVPTRIVQRVKVYLAGRSVRDRRRVALGRLRRPVGRAVARAFAYGVRVVQRQASRSQARRRMIRSFRLKPVGRAVARAFAYPVRTLVLQAGRSASRRRALRSRLRREVGRALARAVPYRVRVFLAGRSVRDRRRGLRGRLGRPLRALVIFPRRVQVFLAGRATRDRRRAVRLRLGRPLRLVAVFPRRIRAYLAGRAVRDRRRTLRSRVRLPVGRALARVRPYAVRTVGTVARRSTSRLRRWASLLRHPVLVRVPPVIGKGVVGSVAQTVGDVLSALLAVGQLRSAELALGVVNSSPAAVGLVSSYVIDPNAGAQP